MCNGLNINRASDSSHLLIPVKETGKMKQSTWQAWLPTFVFIAIFARESCAQADTNSGGDIQLYGGDIVLTPEQQATLEATSNPNDPFAPLNAVVRSTRSLWPNGRVPYELDRSLSSSARTAIQQAIEEFKTLTCIRLVQRSRSTERNYVYFFRGNGCYSNIGRIGGRQRISIGFGCETKGTVIHEIFHALGREHEQNRPDRDGYVTINEANIQPGHERNFRAASSRFFTTQGVPYDMASIMHYGAYDFSRNRRPTIVPLDSSIPLSSLGQDNGFSQRDLQHIKALYCNKDPPNTVMWSSWGTWSSCSQTCNGGTRYRTRTCVGGTTCTGSNIDKRQCNTNPCTRAAKWGTWSIWSGCSASCGGGRQYRTRKCLNGNICIGKNTEFHDCNTQRCSGSSSWATWGSWSECSATCQGGFQIRHRTCQNGNYCPNAGFQVQYCNSKIPCSSQLTYTHTSNKWEWSTWSECTRSCGGGVQFRVKPCEGNNSYCASEQQMCNTQDCNPEPKLRGIRHIGCYYYMPQFNHSLTLLEEMTPDLSDEPSTRTDPIRKCGQAAQDFSFNFFALSANYCISGTNKSSDYQQKQSTLCRDGVGGYSLGYFVMDVYQINNAQAFQVSAHQITNHSPAFTSSVLTLVLSMHAVFMTALTILP